MTDRTPNEEPTTGHAADPPPGPTRTSPVVLGVAVTLIVVFVVVSILLMTWADDASATETVWSRYMYIYGGFEAIVFTGAGWLFGTRVSRSAVKVAQADAAAAKKDAAAAQEEVSKSKKLLGMARIVADTVDTRHATSHVSFAEVGPSQPPEADAPVHPERPASDESSTILTAFKRELDRLYPR